MNYNNIYTHILKCFSLIYDISFEKLSALVCWGETASKPIHIPSGGQPFFHTNKPFPTYRFIEYSSVQLPVFFSQQAIKNEPFTVVEGKVVFHFDLIGAAFYFLSGWQEVHTSKKDSYGRFPYSESIQKQLNIAHLPVVNYYFDMLRDALAYTLNKPVNYREIYRYPSGFLTHDIDKINTGWLEESFTALKQKKYHTLLSYFHKKLFDKDVWDNIPEIIHLEQTLQVKSTFYFLPEKGKYKNVKNADYSVNQVKKYISLLKQKGWATGVHGSYGSAFNLKKLRENSARLDYPKHNRFHFLSWDAKKSPAILESAGIQTDATLGFAETPGFRNGIAHPFYLYDFENQKTSRVLEIPLHIMDTTFVHYQQVTPYDFPLAISSIVQQTAKFNGVLGILWHNNFFNSLKYKGWDAAYLNLVKYLQAENFKFILPDDMVFGENALEKEI